MPEIAREVRASRKSSFEFILILFQKLVELNKSFEHANRESIRNGRIDLAALWNQENNKQEATSGHDNASYARIETNAYVRQAEWFELNNSISFKNKAQSITFLK